MAQKIAIPSASTPVLNPDGTMAPVWYRVELALVSAVAEITTLQARIASLEQQIADLTVRVTDLE